MIEHNSKYGKKGDVGRLTLSNSYEVEVIEDKRTPTLEAYRFRVLRLLGKGNFNYKVGDTFECSQAIGGKRWKFESWQIN